MKAQNILNTNPTHDPISPHSIWVRTLTQNWRRTLTPANTKLAGILIDQLDTLGIKDGDGQERERTRFTLFTEIQIHVEHAHGGLTIDVPGWVIRMPRVK